MLAEFPTDASIVVSVLACATEAAMLAPADAATQGDSAIAFGVAVAEPVTLPPVTVTAAEEPMMLLTVGEICALDSSPRPAPPYPATTAVSCASTESVELELSWNEWTV